MHANILVNLKALLKVDQVYKIMGFQLRVVLLLYTVPS